MSAGGRQREDGHYILRPKFLKGPESYQEGSLDDVQLFVREEQGETDTAPSSFLYPILPQLHSFTCTQHCAPCQNRRPGVLSAVGLQGGNHPLLSATTNRSKEGNLIPLNDTCIVMNLVSQAVLSLFSRPTLMAEPTG
ncbi:uncharacterized protein AB9W97_007593 isoform 1-T1 [Spinachia spinachia]